MTLSPDTLLDQPPGKCMAELHELDEGWTVTVTFRDNTSKTFACLDLTRTLDTLRRELHLHLESLEDPGVLIG